MRTKWTEMNLSRPKWIKILDDVAQKDWIDQMGLNRPNETKLDCSELKWTEINQIGSKCYDDVV